MRAEVVATGIPFPEGPVWCADGTLVVTSVTAGALYRVDVSNGSTRLCADTGGGANGAAAASDGGFLVAQNGGVDLRVTGIIPDAPPPRKATPGLQRVRPDGTVEYLAEGGFNAPNDLVVAESGVVYFTDSGQFPPSDPPIARVIAYHPDGSTRLVAGDFWFCNGIGIEPSGSLAVIEKVGLQRVAVDGSEREWIIEWLGDGAGDGFALDEDGRFYVASTVEHGVRVVEPDGTVADFLEIEGDGLSTNCCFGGPDLRTLFVTDALPGQVVAFDGMPSKGLALHEWPAP